MPNPRETESDVEGPAAWTRQRALEPSEEMPRASPVELNRERELGLDRRETG